jgi:hypothetical protein
MCFHLYLGAAIRGSVLFYYNDGPEDSKMESRSPLQPHSYSQSHGWEQLLRGELKAT